MDAVSSAFLKYIIFVTLIMLSASTCDSTSAYQALEEYGFPKGLLPTNVESYSLDTSDGSFVVNLTSSCSFKIDSYRLKYQKEFTGKLSIDLLKDLDGISVKVWFFYMGISKVLREGNELEFYVGSFSASFPVTNFYECPQCGCGFDCEESSRARIQDS